jgi:hypothetical protein
MPLTEEQIKELLRRCIAGKISPEEMQELMEVYIDLSPTDRFTIDNMINHEPLLRDLGYFDEFNKEVDALAKQEFGDVGPDETEPSDQEDPNEPTGPAKPSPSAN